MRCAFERAANALPNATVERNLRFADHPVRFRVVGTTLGSALREPFGHLQAGDGAVESPALTIEVWDAAETGVPGPPAMPVDDGWLTWPLDDGVLSASPDGMFVRFQGPRSATWLDLTTGSLVGWRADGRDLTLSERAKPLSHFLHRWYASRGVQLVHAGLVELHGRGVLVGGPRGAGKSTTALACLAGGFRYLADDHCGLQSDPEGGFTGHSLFDCARVQPEHLPRFAAEIRDAVRHDGTAADKALLFLAARFPDRIQPKARIHAVVLPRVVGGHCQVRPASAAQALLRLAPSSLLMVLGPGAGGLERLSELAQHVPAFWLDLGDDLDAVPGLVSAVLQSVSAT